MAIFLQTSKMSTLEYNQITERKYIVLDGDPYEVISSHVFRKQQRKPVNATKLRNLVTGKVTERSFHGSDKAEEAEIDNRNIKYLYTNRGESWFCEAGDPSKRFKLEKELIGDQLKFLKENNTVTAVSFKEKIIGIKLPIKVDLEVTEAPPSIKGDTASGGGKQVTLETGAVVTAPLFIKTGDILRINTETGQYTDRVTN